GSSGATSFTTDTSSSHSSHRNETGSGTAGTYTQDDSSSFSESFSTTDGTGTTTNSSSSSSSTHGAGTLALPGAGGNGPAPAAFNCFPVGLVCLFGNMAAKDDEDVAKAPKPEKGKEPKHILPDDVMKDETLYRSLKLGEDAIEFDKKN